MRAIRTILKAWRPQMIGFVCEMIHYESKLVACRVCPEHQTVLDDELRCPKGHEADYWEVKYMRAGKLEAEVLHRATECDVEGRKPLQPLPQGCILARRRQRYLIETSWLLRKKHGLSREEAQAEALRRWEQRCANSIA